MGVNKEVKARKRRLPKGGGIGCASWQTIEIQEENYAQQKTRDDPLHLAIH